MITVYAQTRGVSGVPDWGTGRANDQADLGAARLCLSWTQRKSRRHLFIYRKNGLLVHENNLWISGSVHPETLDVAPAPYEAPGWTIGFSISIFKLTYILV